MDDDEEYRDQKKKKKKKEKRRKKKPAYTLLFLDWNAINSELCLNLLHVDPYVYIIPLPWKKEGGDLLPSPLSVFPLFLLLHIGWRTSISTRLSTLYTSRRKHRPTRGRIRRNRERVEEESNLGWGGWSPVVILPLTTSAISLAPYSLSSVWLQVRSIWSMGLESMSPCSLTLPIIIDPPPFFFSRSFVCLCVRVCVCFWGHPVDPTCLYISILSLFPVISPIIPRPLRAHRSARPAVCLSSAHTCLSLSLLLPPSISSSSRCTPVLLSSSSSL